MLLALLLLAGHVSAEELSLRTLLHRVELVHFVDWKAQRDDIEDADRRLHNALDRAGATP